MSEEGGTLGMKLGAVLGPLPVNEVPVNDVKAALLLIADHPRILRAIRLRLEMTHPHKRPERFPHILRAIAESLP
jgi:hypothetical protein